MELTRIECRHTDEKSEKGIILFRSLIESIRDWFRTPEIGKSQAADDAGATDKAVSQSMALVQEVFETGRETGPSRTRTRNRRPRKRPDQEGQPSPSGRRRSTPRKPAGVAQDWDPGQFTVEPAEGKMRFHDLDLPRDLMHAIFDLQFQYCTPIQQALLPKVLEGADSVGQAQTGTGKSAVFLIGILSLFARKPAPENRRAAQPRALILAPTRELVLQIVKDAKLLAKYMPYSIVAVYGGMAYERQKKQLAERPVDIVVATPGRLIDYMRGGEIDLSKVEVLVIDEADRMLDMGFIPDVQRIVHGTPGKAQRQTMFFSATMTPEVTRLACQWTRNPEVVNIEPEQVAVNTVNQVVYITTTEEKFPLLYNLITTQNLERVIVFTNRRDQARRLTEKFKRYDISSSLLSGEVAQNQRIRTLEDFRAGKIRVLVATDVAARGLHVEGVSHVVNFTLPPDPEDYVHRIGRTGRAGASGISVSFACEEDSFHIPAIEKFLGHEIHCEHPSEDLIKAPPPPTARAEAKPRAPRKRPSAPRSRRSGPPPRRSPKKEADTV